jgi:hypothetical protein
MFYGKNGKDWLMKEKRLKEGQKKLYRITFSWDFLQSPAWKKMSESDQENAINSLMDRYALQHIRLLVFFCASWFYLVTITVVCAIP